MSAVKFRVGRRLQSASLVADAWNDTVDFFALDVRVSSAMPLLGASRLQLVGEIFSVTDRVSFTNPGGDQRLSSFLDQRNLRQGNTSRKGQISFRYSF